MRKVIGVICEKCKKFVMDTTPDGSIVCNGCGVVYAVTEASSSSIGNNVNVSYSINDLPKGAAAKWKN